MIEKSFRQIDSLVISFAKTVFSRNFFMKNLSTSIYDLVLIYVCHFHHHFLLQLPLLKFDQFDRYRDTRASILDPCIQGIFDSKMKLHLSDVSADF